MKLTINIRKSDAEHVKEGHTFYDCCEEVERIMLAVQQAAAKKLRDVE